MTDTPCSTGNHDDWFISKDGKQYGFDELLTEAEVRTISRSVLAKAGESTEEHQARVDLAVRQATSARKREALARRRHAKEACIGCPFRGPCLDIALSEPTPANHGTWGGYYEEELATIRRERRKRARSRA